MAEISVAVNHTGWEPGDVISVFPDNWIYIASDKYDPTPPAQGGEIKIRLPLVEVGTLSFLHQPKRDAAGVVIQRRRWRLRGDLFDLFKTKLAPITALLLAIQVKEGQPLDWFIEK